MSAMTASMVKPTPATRIALELMAFTVAASAWFLLLQYPRLPWLLPVHFRANGLPNGWQYKTILRVLLPVFVQLALAIPLSAISTLLLSRPHSEQNADAPDVKAAAAAAEAVALIALIWVAFQGYAALALTGMWTVERDGLGFLYVILEVTGFVLTGFVAVRAHLLLGHPTPRPYVAEHWRFGQVYRNPDDPALFVPSRDGSRWTINFGRSIAAGLMAIILVIGAVSPVVILALALRS